MMSVDIRPDQLVIIAGAAKSGTTSLFDYLSEHPQVCPSIKKEPEFFVENRVRWREIRRYEDFWPNFNPAVHRYAIEASCRYTMRHDERGVAERMKAYGIRPRLIYLVRDPVARIASHVNHRMRHIRGRQSFEDPLVVESSRYAWQLEPFVKTFGRDSIRVIDFADLCTDPNRVCGDIYDWLALEPHVLTDPGISNEGASVRTSYVERLPILKRLGRRLPIHLHGPAKSVAQKIVPYRHQVARMSPEEARRIRVRLNEDVSRLKRDWDVDVSDWGFESVPDRDH